MAKRSDVAPESAPRVRDQAPSGIYGPDGVIVLDGHDKVLHSELVAEIGDEPDYAAATAVLK